MKYLFEFNTFFTVLIEVSCKILEVFFKCAASEKELQCTDVVQWLPTFLHQQTSKIFKNVHRPATKDHIENRTDF